MGKATNAGKMEKMGVKGGNVKKNNSPNAKQGGKGKAVANGKNKNQRNNSKGKNPPQKKKNEEEEDANDTTMDESDVSVPNILGASLADDSDDNDVDFDAKKGVKMFKGVPKDGESEDEEDSDDDDSEDDEDDDLPGCKALLGSTLIDDEDDDDFEAGSDDDDDEDDDIDDDEDDDVQANDKSKTSKKVTYTEEEKAAKDKKTIYIGNVPSDVTEDKIKAQCEKYGATERIVLKKIFTKNFNSKKKVFVRIANVYVTFDNEESAKKATAMNGQQLDGYYLRVNLINQRAPLDSKKTVYLGGLPYTANENDVYEFFKSCGKIDHVQLYRHTESHKCNGTGHVLFETEDAGTLALDLNGKQFQDREIRVTSYVHDPSKTTAKKRPFSGKDQKQSPKKSKNATKKNSFQGQKAEGKNKKSPQNKATKKQKQMAKKLTSKPKKPTV